MPRSSPSEHRQEPDYIYVGIVCVCLITLAVPLVAGIFSLQHQLPPTDSLLSGPTQNGELMFLVPTILISILAAFRVAWPLTKWVRRLLRLPDRSPLILAGWAKSIDWRSKNWRLAGGIAGVVLVLVAAKGFGSYFYVTESGISVRPPLEFSMRHYEWKDVTTVRVRCIRSIVKSKNRFRYVLKMSDGYEVDLSGALGATTEKVRAAYAARFAESIPSHLNTVPGIVYEFDVSRDGLALLGEKRGMVLPNTIREQVLAHGGTLQ